MNYWENTPTYFASVKNKTSTGQINRTAPIGRMIKNGRYSRDVYGIHMFRNLEHFSTVVKSVAEMFAFDKCTSELLFCLKTGNHATNYL